MSAVHDDDSPFGGKIRPGWRASSANLLEESGRDRITVRLGGRAPSRHASPTISDSTVRMRSGVVFSSMRFLHGRFHIETVQQLRGRHVRALVEHWLEQKLAASTLQNRMSVLRWWAAAIGKKGLVREIAAYVNDPAMIPARTYVAVENRSWEARGVDPDVIDSRVEWRCSTAVAMYRLQRYFGLRTNEVLQWIPLLQAHEAGIMVDRGTKGGRPRMVLFSTDPAIAAKQREAVDFSKKIVLARQYGQKRISIAEPLGYPMMTLEGSRRAYYRVMNQAGVHASRGIRLHDLRHARAQDEFALHAGVEPPVRGGLPAPRDIALAARHYVSEFLGHSRPQITNAYLGSDRAAKKQRAQMLIDIDAPAPNDRPDDELDGDKTPPTAGDHREPPLTE